MPSTTHRFRTGVVAAAVVAAGLLGGAALGTTVAANADAGSTPSAAVSTASGTQTSPSGAPAAVDESRSQRSDEHLLTGTDADKARAAALAKYPGATVQRVETDSDGVYEAHIVTADGQRLVVQMDESFAVTGTDSGPGGGAAAPPQAPTA